MKIVKKVGLTLLFPALMFAAMLLITYLNPKCHVNGNFIFLGSDLLRYVVRYTCLSTCVALAIWLQLKNGRFDFSGGSTMVLTSIIAGTIGRNANSPLLAMILAVGISVLLSSITACVYIVGRFPIIITTIGMTLLYESLTYLVCGGGGISVFYQKAELSVFGRIPMIFIPTVLAILVYILFDRFTVAGRKGKILANNQSAGVNIGIDERKNVFVTYVFTGIIIGFASIIYVSQNNVTPQSGLSTANVMFAYIVPVFMGMFIGMASKSDVIGILMASIALAIMNYGLNCMNLGAGGWQQIIFGIFVMCFYTLSGQLGNIQKFFSKRKAANGLQA